MTHTTDGRVEVDCSAFVYEFKFVITPNERNTYISVHKNHIIKVEDNVMITHADYQTRRYDLKKTSLVADNDFTCMKELVNSSIDKNCNKKKIKFSIYMLSNKPKLDTFKYVFVFKEFAIRKIEELKKQKS